MFEAFINDINKKLISFRNTNRQTITEEINSLYPSANIIMNQSTDGTGGNNVMIERQKHILQTMCDDILFTSYQDIFDGMTVGEVGNTRNHSYWENSNNTESRLNSPILLSTETFANLAAMQTANPGVMDKTRDERRLKGLCAVYDRMILDMFFVLYHSGL
jgi:hypothetical protein